MSEATPPYKPTSDLALLNAGLAFPTIGAACELGFGWGLGPVFHASTSEAQWHGTDVNPTQAKFAQDLAARTETNSVLRDDSFDEFAKRRYASAEGRLYVVTDDVGLSVSVSTRRKCPRSRQWTRS